MAGKKSIEKIVNAAYAARARGDFEAMAALFAPRASLRIAGIPEHCAISGTTTGRARLSAHFAELAQFAFRGQKMVSLTADGDRAAVHWRVKVTYGPTGKSETTEFCDLWTIKYGKVASLVQFLDTALVAEMMKP